MTDGRHMILQTLCLLHQNIYSQSQLLPEKIQLDIENVEEIFTSMHKLYYILLNFQTGTDHTKCSQFTTLNFSFSDLPDIVLFKGQCNN